MTKIRICEADEIGALPRGKRAMAGIPIRLHWDGNVCKGDLSLPLPDGRALLITASCSKREAARRVGWEPTDLGRAVQLRQYIAACGGEDDELGGHIGQRGGRRSVAARDCGPDEYWVAEKPGRGGHKASCEPLTRAMKARIKYKMVGRHTYGQGRAKTRPTPEKNPTYAQAHNAYLRVMKGIPVKEPARILIGHLKDRGKTPPKWLKYAARKKWPTKYRTFLKSAARFVIENYELDARIPGRKVTFRQALEGLREMSLGLAGTPGKQPTNFIKEIGEGIIDLVESEVLADIFDAIGDVISNPIFMAALAAVPGIGTVAAVALAAAAAAKGVYDVAKEAKDTVDEVIETVEDVVETAEDIKEAFDDPKKAGSRAAKKAAGREAQKAVDAGRRLMGAAKYDAEVRSGKRKKPRRSPNSSGRFAGTYFTTGQQFAIKRDVATLADFKRKSKKTKKRASKSRRRRAERELRALLRKAQKKNRKIRRKKAARARKIIRKIPKVTAHPPTKAQVFKYVVELEDRLYDINLKERAA